MSKDIDDDDEKVTNIIRYAVMPSLASLRLMRNRLHLASLGKKLMKWTAISTGRELRKIAGNLMALYKTFSYDMIEAYIKLARSRYFYPTLNDRVIEHCPPLAKITVTRTTKTGAGVRTTHYIIRDTEIDGYEHLGIEKGGQCIKETKEAWERLLKQIIMMLELRISFLQVEEAYKTANKKYNVLKRVQIPRILLTVRYVLTELDEQEREEMFRLKRFKEKKNKNKAPKKKNKLIQEVLMKVIVEKPESCHSVCEVCSVVMKTSDTKQEEPEEEIESENKLELLKKHLQEVIALSKNVLDNGLKNNIKEFLGACNEAQDKIDQLVQDEGQPSEVDEKLKNHMEHLKLHLREVIDATRAFYDEPSTPTSADVSEEIIPCCMQEAFPETSICTENSMGELKNHLDEIDKLMGDYKKEGLMSKSVEEFLTSCDHVKSKVNVYAKEMDEARNQKLELLRKQVTFVEKSANNIDNQDDMKEFLCSCKNFKGKLDEYKQKGLAPAKDSLGILLNQIMKTKELSRKAEKEGFESQNLETFFKSCDDMKTHIEKKPNDEIKEQPKYLKELQHNISEIMEQVGKCWEEGTLTDSAEAFLESCQEAKKKIRSLGKKSKSLLEPNVIPSCSCSQSKKASDEIICGKCADEIKPDTKKIPPPPPCDYCSNSFYDTQSEKVMHDTCFQDPFNEENWIPYFSSKPSEDNTCGVCKKSTNEDFSKDYADLPEGHLQILTKIKRVHHADGSVSEVRETIRIKHSAEEEEDGRQEYNCEHKNYSCMTENQNQSGFSKCVKKVTSERNTTYVPMAEPCSRKFISMDNLMSMNKNLQSPDNVSMETVDFLIDYLESRKKKSKTDDENNCCSSKNK